MGGRVSFQLDGGRVREAPRRAGARIARRPGPRRRGTILIVLLIVLVMLQIALVGAATAGARDQDLVVDRLEGARATLAAEAGMQMAIREWMLQADEDGDGGIGSISDDSNENTDPALGAARWNVAAAVSGANTILTVRGRCGSATRQFQVTVTR